MRTTLLVTTGLAIALVAPVSAGADDPERLALAAVRLTTDPGVVRGCSNVGAAHDDSIKDLRRKIVRAGGNAAVMSFRPHEVSTVHVQIYRCPVAASGSPPPGVPAPPPGTPPPPPGNPPPPPAGPVR